MSGSDRGRITDALREAGLGPVPILEKPFGLGDLELFLAALAPPRNTVTAAVP